MTRQATLFDDIPEQAGKVLAELCAEKAESLGWDREAAGTFIVDYLRRHGPTSGEILVTAASEIYRPHDGRAYGAILARLSIRGVIRKAGYAQRAKGHGTGGAIIWQLTGEAP